MLIGKKWKIEADSLNIILYKRYTVKATDKKPKHDYWKVEGYFSRVENALAYLVDLEVAETELKDLRTVIEKLNQLYELIESLGIK